MAVEPDTTASEQDRRAPEPSSKKANFVPLAAGILLNLFIPFLGNLLTAERGKQAWLFTLICGAIALLFLFRNDNDVLFSYVYIRHASIMLATGMLVLIVVSSWMLISNRASLRLGLWKLVLVVPFLFVYELIVPQYMPRSSVVAANSLSPYARAGDVGSSRPLTTTIILGLLLW